jgi:uncharacterized membrane protein
MNKYINKYNDIQPIKFSTDNNNKSKVQNRLKSKVVWMSITTSILLIIGNLGLYKKIGITEDATKAIVNSILEMLTVVGILNNPKDVEKF